MTPTEGLLRTPLEVVPALVAFAGAGLVAAVPDFFLLGYLPARYAAIGILLALGAVRTVQAAAVVRYRIGLGRRGMAPVRADAIPARTDCIYLGDGFRWLPLHAQRLSEIRRSPERARPAAATGWLAQTDRDAPDPSGDACIHGVGTRRHPVWMRCADRTGHTLVLGTTRVGKTRLAELIVAQDIRRGSTVIFFDPKGDAALLRRMQAEAARCGRADRFRFLHLGFPERSSRYNPIGRYGRITEVAGRVTAQLPDVAQSASFRNFAWRYANIVARALDALGIEPTFDRLRRATENIDPLLIKYYLFWLRRNGPQDWRQDFVEFERRANNRRDTYVTIPREMKSRDPRAAALVMYVRDRLRHPGDSVIGAMEQVLRYDRSYFDKLIASLLPFLEKVTTGSLGSLISPRADDGDPRPVFDWIRVLNEGGIVYVGLDTLADRDVGSAIGHAMFSDLKSVAASLYKAGADPDRFPELRGALGRAVCVHADEMNEIAGEEVTGMFNKAGGAGFQMTVYAQTVQDLEVRLRSAAAAEQQIGNLNTLIMLRVKNRETASLLASQLPRTETVYRHAGSSWGEDAGGFSSRSGTEARAAAQPLVQESDLMSLPKGEAFALLSGGSLYKLRIPLIADDGTPPEEG